MSRLAGIILERDTAEAKALLEAMLTASQSDRAWVTAVETAAPAVVGWCGARAANLAAVEDVLVVIDGAIYNRQDLGAATSDAALLAQLYRRHGFPGALERINGDFASALYDTRAGTLWLGRDRFGVKPLYYVGKGSCVAFASRPRALLGLPGVSSEVDRRFVGIFAASHYRYFDNAPERSPYRDIAQVPAAHALKIHAGRPTLVRYWNLHDRADLTDPEAELADLYLELLLDAVGLRLAEARRPAFMLSGGMDSSSVLASAARGSGTPRPAFSTVYADRTYDESDEISSMLDGPVQTWHPVRVDAPDVPGLVARMIAVHDEPVATATWLAHFVLCEAARGAGFGSLFGGLGGDELNAGEYEYFLYHFADLRTRGDERLAHEVTMWARHHDHPVFRKNPAVMHEGLARLVDLERPGRCRVDVERLRGYGVALDPNYFDLSGFEPVMEHPFRDYLRNRAYQDLTRETIPCCLRAEDRHAAAFGLDHFEPFLDHRLVEFMFRVPGDLKIRDGVTKRLLREAMRGVLPEATRTRIKKTGWNAPAHRWFSGRGREPLLDLVHSRAFRERGIYRVPEVLRLIDEHDRIVASGEPRENHMMFLWQLLNLETWLVAVDRGLPARAAA